MRILVLSDIHSNWAALAAIQEPHDACLFLGDLVDYGPAPAECVRWAMQHVHHGVRGNHDHGVAQGVPIEGETGYRYLTKVSRPHQWPALDADERRYLLQLPLTRRVVLDGKRFLLVHGTPRDPLDEYLTNDPDAWGRRLERCEADIVCVGHTHMQFNIRSGNTVILNPGSVGQPRDGDPRAAYAVIEDNRIELKRIEYPVEETIQRVEASPLSAHARAVLVASLRTGRLPSEAYQPPPPSNGHALVTPDPAGITEAPPA